MGRFFIAICQAAIVISVAFMDLLKAQPLRRPCNHFSIIQIHDDRQVEKQRLTVNLHPYAYNRAAGAIRSETQTWPGFTGLNWRFNWFFETGKHVLNP
ncbi:MAG: hypothetical protein JWP57_1045 [Spirosoma sp.]|nr:hypothetical protein [Spirosoma sp.]